MKIILVGPRVYNGLIDSLIWNYQLPLQALGHEVCLLDTTLQNNTERLEKLVEEFTPDLIFSILSCGAGPPHFEPVEVIKKITEEGKITTFNWFADDVWRFGNFSSNVCWNFTACSTTEPAYVEKYKEIDYDNIVEANWHANSDLYSNFARTIKHDVTFIGTPYGDREEYIKFLRDSGIHINVCSGLSFEQMIATTSNSLICLNFSVNPNKPETTQMKSRPFEIAACNSLIVSQHHPGLEKYFEENKEIVFFDSKEELLNKLQKLLANRHIALRLSEAGFARYSRDHTSKRRLKDLLEWLRTL